MNEYDGLVIQTINNAHIEGKGVSIIVDNLSPRLAKSLGFNESTTSSVIYCGVYIERMKTVQAVENPKWNRDRKNG